MQRVIDVEVSHNQLLFRYSNHRQLMSYTRPGQGYINGNGAIRYLANIKLCFKRKQLMLHDILLISSFFLVSLKPVSEYTHQ